MDTTAPTIGTDESGKGDYFGPLAIAAVHLDPEGLRVLEDEPLRDSKTLSEAQVDRLGSLLRRVLVHSVVTIMPERYNELYSRIRNLNRLLAWGHARAIENVLARVECGEVIADQFGDRKYIEGALMKRGKMIRLIQRPRAESHPAVAAASIIARHEFLLRLRWLSVRCGLALPRGASEMVDNAAAALVRRHGPGVLRSVAKLHFRNTARVMAPGP